MLPPELVSRGKSVRHEGATMLLLTDSAFEPVTLAELKAHAKLRASITVEDDKLTGLIVAARRVIEALTNKIIVQQVWEQTQDAMGSIYECKRGPVISVEKLEYIPDFDADTRVLYSSAGYTRSRNKIAARSAWPTHRGWQSWITTFKAGYASHDSLTGLTDEQRTAAETAARALIPHNLREAVLQLAGHLYEHREGQPMEIRYEVMAKNFATIPANIFTLVHEFMSWRL